ncbi:MAG TPA: SAM-dependent methyltransferase [Armatimonadota bacterium]|nr:SAM-dependent methyltransferase [Armatimonadota bacterium]
MPFTLDQVVPWGRTFDEYVHMFALTEDDLRLTILGCGDGPASFNAEGTQQGYHITSCDPIYRFSIHDLAARFTQVYDQVMEQLHTNVRDYVWTHFRTPEEVGRHRMHAMELFLADLDQGSAEGRYIDAGLPQLPFAEKRFDIALSSHFLFLYADHFSCDFHLAAVRELCRVAHDVRIFPLQNLGGQPTAYVQAVIADVTAAGCSATIEPVPYEFQRSSNAMLHIRCD